MVASLISIEFMYGLSIKKYFALGPSYPEARIMNDYIVNWNLFPVSSIVFIINTAVKETNTNNSVCYFYWCSVELS